MRTMTTYITFPEGSDLRRRLSNWSETFSKLKDGSMAKKNMKREKALILNL